MKHAGQPRLSTYTLNRLDQITKLDELPAADRQAMKVVAHVLPFRTNNYVLDELIDWNNIPGDPIFQLSSP